MRELVAMIVTICIIQLQLKPNSGIKRVDDFLAYVREQKANIANAAVLVGISVLFAQYLQDYLEQQ